MVCGLLQSGLLQSKVVDSFICTMFLKLLLNYSPSGSLGSNQVALALSNIRGCILQALAVLEFVY